MHLAREAIYLSISIKPHVPPLEIVSIYAASFRSRIEPLWNSETCSPYWTVDGGKPIASRGQCAPSSIELQRSLREELGVDSKLTIGTVRYAGLETAAIGYHVWLTLQDYEKRPLLDITADQAYGIDDRFIMGSISYVTEAYGLTYIEHRTGALSIPRLDMYNRARRLSALLEISELTSARV